MKQQEQTEPKQKPTIQERGKDGVRNFLEFIKGQGVIGFAVGLVLGTAASTLVNSLINNVVMPPLGFLLGSSDGLRGLSWDMGVTASGERAVLNYGVFLADFINFLIIAMVIYLVVKWLKVEIKKK